MKLKLTALSLCILCSQVYFVQAQQSVEYASFLKKISSFVTSVKDVISGPAELKTLTDAVGCGKRNTRDNKESTLAECLWNCEWDTPSMEYTENFYRNFIRTPVRWNNTGGAGTVIKNAMYTDPEEVFPDGYVKYTQILYGQESTTASFYIDHFMSLPRLPKDTFCLKDCIYPVNSRETRIRVCIDSAREWLGTKWPLIKNLFVDIDQNTGALGPVPPPLLIFYECMIALNVETIDKEFEDSQIRRSGKSFSRDYQMLTIEICFLAERDWYLYYISDKTWTDFVMDDISSLSTSSQRQGCDEIFAILLDALLNTSFADFLTQAVKRSSIENNTNSVSRNYRDGLLYGELAKEDILLRTDNERDDNRLTGASVFPTDLDLIENSQHHPWACSLRTRGYRGRHRCGVTLLYGPQKDHSETHDDPYVLVSAAHCNYICKDRIRGDVLETCCCRPPNAEGTCAANSERKKASPFCTGQPVFVLAEPEDLVIVCGEFNSGVEIINDSSEPEQVFTVTKIIQHPDYKPTTADIGPGSGGPIDGNDIAVYHVYHKDGFKLGDVVDVRESENLNDLPELKQSTNYIWPVCLPKDDNDQYFTSDHPKKTVGKVDAMLAGWLDAPPIGQAFSNLLGSSLTEVDVLKLYYYPRVMGLEEMDKCTDPQYQRDLMPNKASTFYPKGTICYKDPSSDSCPEFGSSGSGIVRLWRKRGDRKAFTIDTACNPFVTSCQQGQAIIQQQVDTYQYSFVGPLSMQKGCDNAFHMYTLKTQANKNIYKGEVDPNNGIGYETNKLSYRGENPLVAADARCFMPWIASQYNMKLEKDYAERLNCDEDQGDKDNANNKDDCYANFLGVPKKCNFDLCEDITKPCEPQDKWDSCRVLTKEGIAFNVNECLIQLTAQEGVALGLPNVTANYRATCFNNCKGVNPNAITAAGVALVALSGIGSTAGLGPGAIGIGGAVLAGREVVNSMNGGRCGDGCCRMQGRCCKLVERRGMLICPRRRRGCRACGS